MPSREVEIFTAHCGEILNLAAKGTTEAKAIEDIDGQIAALTVPSPDAEIPVRSSGISSTVRSAETEDSDADQQPGLGTVLELLATLEIDFPPGPQADGGAGFHPARTAFVRHEKAIRKAALLVECMELVEHAPDDDIRKRRLDQRDRLLEALKPGPDESLSKARDVVDETAQNVFIKDLLAEISAKALYLRGRSRDATCVQLTDIGLRFRRPGADAAAARRAIACRWTIDGEPLPSRDWVVTYFFTGRWRLLKALVAKLRRIDVDPDRSLIHVALKQRGQDAVLLELDHTLVLRTKSAVEAQTWLSIGSLLVTLLLIGFGLAAGAEEKLRSLDLLPGAIAVFVLGFSADSLKTMLTRSSE